MGEGMAANLLAHGASLVEWTRTEAKAAELARAHPGKVTMASTAREAVASCRLVYSMLSTLQAVVIMTHFYDQFARYTTGDPASRVQQLNERVLQHCTHSALLNVYAYLTSLATRDQQADRAAHLGRPAVTNLRAKDAPNTPLVPGLAGR